MKNLLLLLFCLGAYHSNAQNRISAKDAAQHIGEVVEVCGVIYGSVIKPDYAKAGAKMALIYFDGNYPNQKCTVIMRHLTRRDQKWIISITNYSSKIANDPNSKIHLTESMVAAGKIFLYNGKPAIEIKCEDLGQLTQKGDASP